VAGHASGAQWNFVDLEYRRAVARTAQEVSTVPDRRPTQDGRPLRRYRRRWRVERLFAWLYRFRRLVIRWEYPVENFFGMVRLGCMQILLRYL
jgi:transposase